MIMKAKSQGLQLEKWAPRKHNDDIFYNVN